jgi:hypothetical protein
MEIQTNADESLAIIEKLRHNIDNIHKAKHNRWNRELVGLLQQNKSLLMHLRKKQRELAESVEVAKEDLIQVVEKTDDLHSTLENLKYQKTCIENETQRIKKLDTRELKELGIPFIGEKETILKLFKEEYDGRNELKALVVQKELELENEKRLLGCVEAKMRILLDCIRRIDVASESLAVHVGNPE